VKRFMRWLLGSLVEERVRQLLPPSAERLKNLTQAEKYQEYRERGKEVLVDFDGTLSTWAYPAFGVPTDGAREALQELRNRGLRIIIWTARMDRTIYTITERLKTFIALADWLDKYKIPFDEIDIGLAGKRLSAFWIDDKCIHFCGDWKDVLNHARVLKEIEDERHGVVIDDVDSGYRSRAGRNGPVPAGWEWETGGGCNDKGTGSIYP